MHSTRTSTALFVSVHAFAVYIGFQGKKEDSTISRRFNHSTVKISAPPAVM